ncbi:hypothetical protein ABFS83_14G157100 [Erythranthe nasuta]
MAEFYFDEIIKVLKFDSLVVYDKVSRINANSEDDDFYLELDVHAEIYQMLPGGKYRMVISNTLHKDGSTGKQASLADKFEYVMHGLLYKMAEAKDAKDDVKVVVYVSFGGLQLMLKGDPLKMHKFKVDQRLFLLLRKM